MRSSTVLSLALLALAPAAAAVTGAEKDPFRTMSAHYEGVRQALLHDTVAGVPAHAESLAAVARDVGRRFESDLVPAHRRTECRRLLPEIEAAAEKLAAAADLAAARVAFGTLSRPMVRYRDMLRGERPMVVSCSMAKQVWLQGPGEIGNPYYGQAMARCGDIVSKK